MNNISRKNILKAAKDNIKQDIIVQLNEIKLKIESEYAKDEEARDTGLLDKLLDEANELTREFNGFKKTNRAKKKASIVWAETETGQAAEKPKKPHREVKDWDAIRQIRSNHANVRPRASAWLKEGCMVVQRGSSMPMMVLSIRNNGIVQVLAGGMTKNLRDVSLRPAFDEE